jgi:hypothetical protein
MAALGPLLLAAWATAGCRSAGGFAPHLPPDLPDLGGWERSEGVAELDGPRRTVEYQLFVAPGRLGVYGVTRYRITLADAAERRAGGLPGHEMLQWDRDGRDVRRYACVPADAPRQPACRWRELARGSREYDDELRPLLSIYALHAALLRQRDDERARR